jgi:beta-phosphoglucomutase-like phosphatase (HAD superfamily)
MVDSEPGATAHIPMKALFFDLDGLLVNTESLHVRAYQAVADHLGIPLAREYVHSFLGAPTKSNVMRIMEDNGVPADEFDRLLKIRYDSYLEIIENTPLHLTEGALPCLDMSRERELITALVTSSIREHAMAVLENVSRTTPGNGSLVDFFSTMVFGDDVPLCKPAPDLYIEATGRLGVEPSEGAALEDSEAGVTSAKAAGLFVIAVPCEETDGQDLSGADVIVSSLVDVCSLDNLR